MLRFQSISSLNLPELAPYRTMRFQAEHKRQGIFVAEGDKVVRRLLESHLQVVSLLLEEKWLRELDSLLQKRTEEIQVYIANREELERLTGYPLFQGVLAVAKIPGPASLEEILQKSSKPNLLVAVEGITNAINLGVIVRNCAAFGVHGLIVSETSSSPFLRRAVRNSMGAIFQLPIIEVESLVQTLRELRSRNIRCIAAHPHAEHEILPQSDLKQDCCLLFGSEGYGLSPEALNACDTAVAIPMTSSVDSLNVASAAAIFLYESFRQRGNFGVKS